MFEWDHGKYYNRLRSRYKLNKLPDFLKTTDNVNRYKHRVKKHVFHRMSNEEKKYFQLLVVIVVVVIILNDTTIISTFIIIIIITYM